jgi:hypothetical protein
MSSTKEEDTALLTRVLRPKSVAFTARVMAKVGNMLANVRTGHETWEAQAMKDVKPDIIPCTWIASIVLALLTLILVITVPDTPLRGRDWLLRVWMVVLCSLALVLLWNAVYLWACANARRLGNKEPLLESLAPGAVAAVPQHVMVRAHAGTRSD